MRERFGGFSLKTIGGKFDRFESQNRGLTDRRTPEVEEAPGMFD